MKFAYNECCDNYSLNSEVLYRFNQIRISKGLPMLRNDANYNDRCMSMRSDPDFVLIVEEFDGDVLEHCDLTVIDVIDYPDLYEMFYRREFDDIADIINSSDFEESQSSSSSEEFDTNSSSDIADTMEREYPCPSLLDENFRPINKY